MTTLSISEVSKFYAQHCALKDISFDVPSGSIFGLLGPNGAGKTSLIRIINQITGPDTGEILFDGEKLRPSHISDIGYLPEERGLYRKMKIGEQITYLAQLKGLSKAETKRKIKFWFERFEIQDWWGKKVEELSKGMQQKVQFISTVIHDPKLLILDEPFSGFDPINTNKIKEEILRLRDEGATVIFSTHRMESVEELCDHIALINKAELVLQGEKKKIKLENKTNRFRVDYEGQLTGLTNPIEEQAPTDGGLSSGILTLLPGEEANELLSKLIRQVTVHNFVELMPSINDIFIQTVNSSNDG